MTIEEFNQKKNDFLLSIQIERNVADNTFRAYKNDLEQFYQFWKKIEVQDKKPLSIKNVVTRFLVVLYHKKINKSTIARKLSCFKSFENFVAAQGAQLALKLKRPRLDKKLPVYLSINEVFYLLDTVQNADLPSRNPLRDKAIFELLYATGVRCSELVSIQMKDINFDQRTITIFGKGRKERLVLFGSKAHERLIQYLSYERITVKNKNEPLFLNGSNKQLTSRTIQRIVQMFRQFLRIERPITPHKIRHSFATHLLNQGADLRIVQELLGHKTLSSTQRYTHVTARQLIDTCLALHPLTHKDKKNNSADEE